MTHIAVSCKNKFIDFIETLIPFSKVESSPATGSLCMFLQTVGGSNTNNIMRIRRMRVHGQASQADTIPYCQHIFHDQSLGIVKSFPIHEHFCNITIKVSVIPIIETT